ncbi:MAG TPA: YihY/virulence factor BrkB family protein [Bryobacteraceae bacterium]|nr:YihY/virulence factor BrkB family protein [Bryobacteraceae bacterium]HPQ14291.1 YihY/virulence factor BrkB family protein [Bryobacteraceae bacterium]
MSGVRKFGGLSWKELLKRVWHEVGADDVLGQAAQLSFYFLLALFPLLLFLTTLFGYFAQSDELRDSLLGYFRRVAPVSAFRLIRETLLEISSGAGRGKLSIGLIGTLWAASKGMAALTAGLNRAYDVKDERPWWKVRLIAIGLTVALSVFTVISQTLILGGGKLGAALAGWFGYQRAFEVAWKVGRWPVAVFFVLIGVNLLYRFAPYRKRPKWEWMSPGAQAAVLLWLAASLGFRFYLRYANHYHLTYGSLGGVIILLLWLYIGGIAILVGAEINAEIERARASGAGASRSS